MHCQNCDCLLFNVTKSQCPECGTAFRVDEYRFPTGSVAFHCNECGQEYYGNDEYGLPYPRKYLCVTCQAPVDVARMKVVPQRTDATGVVADDTPWV